MGGPWSPAKRVGFRFAFVYLILYNLPFPAGVFWDGAGHLVRGDVFRDFAARKLPAQLPLLLWIGCPAWPNTDGTSSGYTVGLRQFGLPEIETTVALAKSLPEAFWPEFRTTVYAPLAGAVRMVPAGATSRTT